MMLKTYQKQRQNTPEFYAFKTLESLIYQGF